MGRRKKGDDVSGWLIIDKPRDMGSTEVVNLTRRLFNARKNGHTGTLDPFATGVLPIAFGEATKVIPFVTDGPKEYEFVIQWGQATSTGDTEGEIIGKTEKSAVALSHSVNSILKSRIGKIICTRSGKDKEIVPIVTRIFNYALIGFCACRRAAA